MRPHILLYSATALFAIGCSARRSDFTAPVPVAGNPSASYRRALADSGVSGQVIAEGVVDTAGAVVPNSITIVQPLHPALDEEVVRVFSLWKFRPAVRDGQVVEQMVRVPFNFVLQPPTAAQCRDLLVQADSDEFRRTGKRLGLGEARSLQPTVIKPLRASGGSNRTVAEFMVDTAGFVDVGTLRIVESSRSTAEAHADLRRVITAWRFKPARVGGCSHAALTRHEFLY